MKRANHWQIVNLIDTAALVNVDGNNIEELLQVLRALPTMTFKNWQHKEFISNLKIMILKTKNLLSLVKMW